MTAAGDRGKSVQSVAKAAATYTNSVLTCARRGALLNKAKYGNASGRIDHLPLL